MTCTFVGTPSSHAATRRLPHALLALLASFTAVAPAAEPEAARLPPVLVTATRFPEDPATLPFGVSVITARQIAESGVATVNEALMKLLGIPGRLDLYGGGDYALDLRGFGATADSNQVIVVDGIRINEADTGGTRLAGIPIDAVERIEVLRGSGTVLYGEGATGGVIVITTRSGPREGRAHRVGLYGAAGSDHLREVRGSASLALGDLDLDVAANRRTADNHRDNFRSEADGASLGLQWRRDALRLGARHATDALDTGLPGALSAAQYDEDPSQTNNPDDHASIRNRRTSVFAEAEFGDWQLAFDAGWREKELRSESFGFPYDYDIEAETYAGRARHRMRVGGAVNALVVGVDRGEWERTVPGLFGSVAEQASTAYYLKDDLTLAGGTRLSAGWRSEAIDKTLSTAADGIDRRQRAWEFGLLQPLSDASSVYARVGRSFRLANVDEFGFTSPGAMLEPQTSRDAELGARWRGTGAGAELRLYRSRLENEIGYDPNADGPFGPGTGANVNFDPTRREGLELELRHAPAASVNLQLVGALRRSRFSAGPYEGKDVPLAPRRTLALRADWVPAAGHRLDAGVNHVGSQHPDFDNACRMPSYTTLDLRYAVRVAFAEIALGVANATDRKFYTQAFRCNGGTTEAIYPEAGRAFTAALRMSF